MSTRASWPRVKALFQTLAEKPEAEREVALRALAPEDAALADEVRALLAAHREGGGAIAEALADASRTLAAAAPTRQRAGRRVGPYVLVRSLGEGGMGEVWLAERADDSFHKEVAVKFVRAGFVTNEALARFHTEREALARLEHPNIVRLLDGGTDEDGAPYFVMEYVDGEPIEAYCEARALSVRERLRLFAQVCSAVEKANRSLIVHRDIKPGNVLVTPAGVVKLLDFGIAKLLDPVSESNFATRTAITPATPAFASPEQLAGAPVTTATDVYALGILLYRLITGQHPYALDSQHIAEVARVIRDTEPSRPSQAVSLSAEKESERRLPLPSLAARRAWSRELRGDLDNITLTALRKEPARRYGSAALLALDVERYLDGLPVSATPDSVRYRAGKFVRRHPLGVAAGTTAVLGLCVLSAIALREAKVAAAQAAAARAEQRKAEAVSAFLQGVFSSADTAAAFFGHKAGTDVTIAEVLVDAAKQAGPRFAKQPDVEAKVRIAIGQSDISLGRYAEGLEQLEIAAERVFAGHSEPYADKPVALHYLGRAQFFLGRTAAAETTLRRVRHEYQILPNPTDENRANLVIAKHDLALVVMETGRFAEAEDLERQAMAELHAQFPSHPAYFLMLAVLGRIRSSRGDATEADTLYRSALAGFDGIPGAHESAERGHTLYSLCWGALLAGRIAEAAPACEEAHTILLHALGPKHRYVGTALVQLGALAHQRGNEESAEALIRQGLGIQRNGLPDGHPEFAATDTALGPVLAARGKAPEGEALLRDALAFRRRTYPPGDWRTAQTESALGEVLEREGNRVEAEPLLREGFTAMRVALGENHAQTLLASRRLEPAHAGRAAP